MPTTATTPKHQRNITNTTIPVIHCLRISIVVVIDIVETVVVAADFCADDRDCHDTYLIVDILLIHVILIDQ
jgi:hypothetical protein